jgi:hypothetical protein
VSLALRRRYPLGEVVIQGHSRSLLPLEEKQRAQISNLVRIAFTECDGSIRAGKSSDKTKPLVVYLQQGVQL